MKTSIMQPNIFMWNGLLKQIFDSDIHIILDHVKASKNERYNRNKIAGKGKPRWMSIPYTNFSINKKIQDLKISTSEENKDKLNNLFISRYSNTPYFHQAHKIFFGTINRKEEESLLTETYSEFLRLLQESGLITCKLIYSSNIINGNASILNLTKIDMVNALLSEVSASTYLASQNTALYSHRSQYRVNNVLFQAFTDKQYPQKFDPESQYDFIAKMSCLDTISCIGTYSILEYLNSCNSWT